MFRRKEFNVTPTTVLIYDMGATKTTATVYGTQLDRFLPNFIRFRQIYVPFFRI